MKPIHLFLLILIVFASCGTQSTSNLFRAESEENIVKLVIYSGASDSLVLTKQDSVWLIDGSIEARDESVELILQAVCEGEIQSPVSESTREKEAQFIQKTVGSIRIYEKNGENFYLQCGRYNAQLNATCIKSSKSDELYYVAVPGIVENYSKILKTEIIYWITPDIFNLKPSEISQITVDYTDNKENSFRIRIENNDFEFFSYPDMKPVSGINKNAVSDYLFKFSEVQFDSIITLNDKMHDSLRSSKPFCTVEVINKNNVKILLKTFPERDSKTGKMNPNRLYALINNDKNLVTATWFSLDFILRKKTFFLK